MKKMASEPFWVGNWLKKASEQFYSYYGVWAILFLPRWKKVSWQIYSYFLYANLVWDEKLMKKWRLLVFVIYRECDALFFPERSPTERNYGNLCKKSSKGIQSIASESYDCNFLLLTSVLLLQLTMIFLLNFQHDRQWGTTRLFRTSHLRQRLLFC